MFFDTNIHTDYDRHIFPFIKNGIIIDTSVILKIIDGLISIRISKKDINDVPTYRNILSFLDIIKVNNRWEKFFITPHILTEVCTHLRNEYSKNKNYKEIVNEVMPILDGMKEKFVCKDNIIRHIDFKNPIIEIGDISIHITTENCISSIGKIAILADDDGLNKIYEDDDQVMIMNYKSAIWNLS